MPTRDPILPPGFRLGTATAAAQIEGGADADGRGPSIWDTFAAEPGRIRGGDTPAVACDHYHRHAEDVRDLADLGVDDYRFSISWSRVLPTGRGRVNGPGLDFYSRLVDDLLAAGIRPVPTLYHWDLPQTLQDEGGWLRRDTSRELADYAAVVVDALGDRVTRWHTLNEMNVHTLYGHGLTDHAPALGMGLDCLPVAHNLLRAHGLAVEAIRASGTRHEVGVVQQHFPVLAATDSAEDLEAAEMFRILTNWLFSDPVLRGEYPQDWVAELVMSSAGLTPDQLEQDLVVIAGPLDHYGVNYYEPTLIEAPRPDTDYSRVLEVDFPQDMPFRPVRIEGVERTDFDWPVVPSGLTDILVALHERYPGLPPVTVTENGASFHEGPGADGAVHDDRRIEYLRAHLAAVADAVEAGVNVDGYYVWSAMDNFEWAAGYAERFGLVHVDHGTLTRTRKDSWYWYRDLIAAQRDRVAGGGPTRPSGEDPAV
ncbi:MULTISPECIES: GH1 family beta-glucosidase [unclassified Dietzia]|uniref:GH1 family beta-glucosidase n=1 Tax=unclassified Dietzia TaxID=2617939 RepID=UPI000D206DD8|nr:MULTISPECIES: GH1 family beta-glucosidase [unclassified Dietzia]AVZ39926.1 beta-glucosidase [Dietzia sp. JS16-p6b]QGW25328.1 putative beta-glucosidase [Dietzia sp. DQ12-45-1b]